MGYDCTLRIKAEYDDKYKTFMSSVSKEELVIEKNALIGYCMTAASQFEEKIDNISLHRIAKDLMFNLKIYINYLVENWKILQKKEWDGSEIDKEGYRVLDYCGWSYSEGRRGDVTWEDVDEYRNYLFEHLYQLVIVSTPDRFSGQDGRDKYYSKYEEICDIISESEDIVNDIMNHDFFYSYKAKEDTLFDESY